MKLLRTLIKAAPPKMYGRSRKKLLQWALYFTEGMCENVLNIAQVGFIDLDKDDQKLFKEMYEKNKEFAARLRLRLK